MSRFCNFSSLTFDDLSRPQMTSDPKNNYRFLKHKLSAFQKHIVWKKSKKSLFRSIFKYVLLSVCLCVRVSVCQCVCVCVCVHLMHLTAPQLPSLTIVVGKGGIWVNESYTYMCRIDFWTPSLRENLSWEGKLINLDEKRKKGKFFNFGHNLTKRNVESLI